MPTTDKTKGKTIKIAYAAAIAVFAFGLVGTILLFFPSNKASGAQQAEVLRDSEMLFCFDLSLEEDRTLRLDYGDSYNLIEIADGKIRVKEAGCKDNTCVKMGWLESAPIVCLPNHLVIRFSSGQGEIDAVAQ